MSKSEKLKIQQCTINSAKTIEEVMKEIENLQYLGIGSNGHW